MKAASLRKTEFDGKEMTNYEASQVQRRLEREIRRQKNRSVIAVSAGDDEMRREAQMKINQLTGKYKDLSDKFGLKTKAERMQVSDYRPVKIITPIQKGVKPESRPFESVKKLHKHFLKHGSDFGFFDDNDENMRLYEKLALEFANKEKKDTIDEFFNKNGFFFRYDSSTNDFLTMKPNGIIETYFKPKDGLKYWEKQKEI